MTDECCERNVSARQLGENFSVFGVAALQYENKT